MRSSPRPHSTLLASVALTLSFAALIAPAASALTTTKPPKPPKVHTAVLGAKLRVTWIASPEAAASSPSTQKQHLALTIRPLLIDGRRKQWTTGPVHDITDHTFAVLEALHINDALPTDRAPHFIWQTGAWLLVDRSTGHVTPLHLAAYDPALTGISWYRDLAAYCSISPSGKILSGTVFQIGSRKAAARKRIAAWPLPPAPGSTLDLNSSNAPAPAASPQPASQSAPFAAPIHSPSVRPPAVRPQPRIPSIAAREQEQETGLPHPANCTTFEWQRDPLRVVITPRPDLPPVALDLGSALSSALSDAPQATKRTKHSDHDDAPASVPAPDSSATPAASAPATATPQKDPDAPSAVSPPTARQSRS
jgi:hypothetical protein